MIAHFFAVISPGPDFAIVTKQSFLYGRKIAIITSFGIGCGILIHVFYCIVGVGLLLSSNPYLFNILKYVGSIYLFYIGILSFISQSNFHNSKSSHEDKILKSFFLGFITNILNPKATLFFLSLFAIAINEATPLYVQVFYGLWMSIITAIWFVVVSVFFTNVSSKIFIKKYSRIINKMMGAILIFISIKLVLF